MHTPSTPASTTSPVGVNAPYRVAPDTYVIPELVPGPPGTYVSLNSMVITGAEPVIVVITCSAASRSG